MSASHDTVEKVLDVVLKHVDRRTAGKIIDELLDIPGNQSFRDTVVRLRDRFSAREWAS